MLQISHKQTHTKGIRTKNPINAKCVQLIELHAFACCLLSFFLAALLGSRRVTVVAQQWQASLSLPSLLGTWLSPSNRRRSAVSSELATAFAPWLLHLLENVPYWLSDAYFYLGQIWIASKIGINRENEVSIGKKIKVDIPGKKLTFDNIRF